VKTLIFERYSDENQQARSQEFRLVLCWRLDGTAGFAIGGERDMKPAKREGEKP
jgi:hypothetical protein